MEISAGFNSSADLLQQYWSWGVDEVCEEESRPFKQLRASPFGNTNCTLLNSSIDRNLAERNRREKLTRRFAALSTLLPALKKRNKASILEEAISYILQLQKKVETLEKKITIKSCDDDVASCSNQSLLSVDTESLALPLIKAKTCNCEVLISIDCERRKGVLENIVGIIDNLHLSIVSCSVVHFGDSELNITIIAEMGKEYSCMSIKEVVNNLHVALKI